MDFRIKKNTGIKFKFFLVCMTLWSSLATASLCVKPLLVGFESWAPYQYLDKTKASIPATGFDAEFTRLITEGLDCKVVFVSMPWKRQQLNIQSGSLDLALAAIPTPERERYSYFSDPYRDEIVKLYLAPKHESLEIENISDLPNLSILLGTELGFFYGNDFADLMQDHNFSINVRPVANTAINMNRLTNESIDGFLAEERVADRFIIKHELTEKMVKHDLVINSSPVRIMVSKVSGNKKFLAALNKEIEKIKDSQQYIDLENKFLK